RFTLQTPNQNTGQSLNPFREFPTIIRTVSSQLGSTNVLSKTSGHVLSFRNEKDDTFIRLPTEIVKSMELDIFIAFDNCESGAATRPPKRGHPRTLTNRRVLPRREWKGQLPKLFSPTNNLPVPKMNGSKNLTCSKVFSRTEGPGLGNGTDHFVRHAQRSFTASVKLQSFSNRRPAVSSSDSAKEKLCDVLGVLLQKVESSDIAVVVGDTNPHCQVPEQPDNIVSSSEPPRIQTNHITISSPWRWSITTSSRIAGWNKMRHLSVAAFRHTLKVHNLLSHREASGHKNETKLSEPASRIPAGPFDIGYYRPKHYSKPSLVRPIDVYLGKRRPSQTTEDVRSEMTHRSIRHGKNLVADNFIVLVNESLVLIFHGLLTPESVHWKFEILHLLHAIDQNYTRFRVFKASSIHEVGNNDHIDKRYRPILISAIHGDGSDRHTVHKNTQDESLVQKSLRLRGLLLGELHFPLENSLKSFRSEGVILICGKLDCFMGISVTGNLRKTSRARSAAKYTLRYQRDDTSFKLDIVAFVHIIFGDGELEAIVFSQLNVRIDNVDVTFCQQHLACAYGTASVSLQYSNGWIFVLLLDCERQKWCFGKRVRIFFEANMAGSVNRLIRRSTKYTRMKMFSEPINYEVSGPQGSMNRKPTNELAVKLFLNRPIT
ncbi:hypothetical protein CLF_110503, partial [Clonorchis sinensis]